MTATAEPKTIVKSFLNMNRGDSHSDVEIVRDKCSIGRGFKRLKVLTFEKKCGGLKKIIILYIVYI